MRRIQSVPKRVSSSARVSGWYGSIFISICNKLGPDSYLLELNIELPKMNVFGGCGEANVSYSILTRGCWLMNTYPTSVRQPQRPNVPKKRHIMIRICTVLWHFNAEEFSQKRIMPVGLRSESGIFRVEYWIVTPFLSSLGRRDASTVPQVIIPKKHLHPGPNLSVHQPFPNQINTMTDYLSFILNSPNECRSEEVGNSPTVTNSHLQFSKLPVIAAIHHQCKSFCDEAPILDVAWLFSHKNLSIIMKMISAANKYLVRKHWTETSFVLFDCVNTIPASSDKAFRTEHL